MIRLPGAIRRMFNVFIKPPQLVESERFHSVNLESSLDEEAPVGMKPLPSVGIFMLDIIACGLGGVFLIAVLYMIIRIPVPPPLSENFIMVEVAASGQGHIGFAIRHDEGPWYHIYHNYKPSGNYIDDRQLLMSDTPLIGGISYTTGFNGCSSSNLQEDAPCMETIAHIYLKQPAIGNWTIEPYYTFYRRQASLYRITALGNIQCSVWTRLKAYLESKALCPPEKGNLGATGARHGMFTIPISS